LVTRIDEPAAGASEGRPAEGIGVGPEAACRFSLDRLVGFLLLLGSDVEIVVKPRTRAAGRARVLVA
jgi:hypothetical protein